MQMQDIEVKCWHIPFYVLNTHRIYTKTSLLYENISVLKLNKNSHFQTDKNIFGSLSSCKIIYFTDKHKSKTSSTSECLLSSSTTSAKSVTLTAFM